MRRIYDHYGPSAMFGRSYGWMSCGEVNSPVTLNRRLLRLCGGFVECTNSYSTAAIAPVLSCIFGESDPRSSDWDDILNNSRRVVLWGCDPLITNDIDWSTTLHNSYPKFDALKASGIKTIVVNPLRTQTGSYLESEWIAPYPGTDCALMLAMIYTLHQSGRLDTDFMSAAPRDSSLLWLMCSAKKTVSSNPPNGPKLSAAFLLKGFVNWRTNFGIIEQ